MNEPVAKKRKVGERNGTNVQNDFGREDGDQSDKVDTDLEDGELPDTESENEIIQGVSESNSSHSKVMNQTGNYDDKLSPDCKSSCIEDDRLPSPPREPSSTLSPSDMANSSQFESTLCSQSSDASPQVTPVKYVSPRKEDIPEPTKISNLNGLPESASCSGMQEFEIIDAFDGTEEGDGVQQEKTTNFDESSDDEYLDDDEIYSMLEQGIDKKSCSSTRETQGDDSNTFVEKEKVILKEYHNNPFDILPEGWLVLTHNSGMPIYLHKESRVCTMSRPYFLGAGSVRKHDLPISAIPCLHYRIAKEKAATAKKEEERKDDETKSLEDTDGQTNSKVNNNQGSSQSKEPAPPPTAKIQVAEVENRNTSINLLEFRKYCEKLFEFHTMTFKKFRRWKDRRIYMRRQNRPTLPSSTKLITCTAPPSADKEPDKRINRKEFVLNPVGKSFICILHEYVQHSLRIQPMYKFEETGNSEKPYSATVVMSGLKYGTGYAASKKQAKLEAAKETMRILMPDMTKMMEAESDRDMQDLSFFDEVRVEDPRVNELCQKAGQPRPYQILLECLKRNYGMGDTSCHVSMKVLKGQKSEFTMSVGAHKATVICKNKREGKHQAAQAILQLLHPHIKNWGSLLRMYGPLFKNQDKMNNSEEEPVTELQGQPNKPNHAVLNKLKQEMTKLKQKREAIKSKGKVTVDALNLPVKRTDSVVL